MQAGYDAVIQAEAGLMSVTGAPDGQPFRLGVPIGDIVTGMFAAQGITSALLARTQTGRGQQIDLSLFDSTAALLTYQASAYLATATPPARLGNAHLSIVPYDTYEARDGLFMLAVGNDEQWRRLCATAGIEELASDPRFVTNPQRVRNREALQPILEQVFRSRDRADWLEHLERAEVPCGAVRHIGEVLADPQLDARGMVAAMAHARAGTVRVVNSPIMMSGGEKLPHRAPPALGEHTETILTTELGLSLDEVEALRAGHVI
jgi:formyl-CoA transferase/CoA:oxalate CoA-transferase